MSLDQSHRVSSLRLDEHGRAIPMTDEEYRAYAENLRRGLEQLRTVPDDPRESDEEFMRTIDAGRPERPLFKRYYEP